MRPRGRGGECFAACPVGDDERHLVTMGEHHPESARAGRLAADDDDSQRPRHASIIAGS
jgi:hypothetical protein